MEIRFLIESTTIMKNQLKPFGIALLAALVLNACSSPFAPSEAEVEQAKRVQELAQKLEAEKREKEYKEEQAKKDPANYKAIDVNELYTMSVPKDMKPTDFLNDEASLQYFNIYKEHYVIVIDESKSEFIEVFKSMDEYDTDLSVVENYAKAQLNFFSEDLTFRKETGLQPMTINDRDALRKSAVADVEGVPNPISYQFAFAEGKKNLYMIMAWTTEENARDFFEQQMFMFKSLKEL